MRSPVSRSPLGECNAIKSWGFGERDLTFDLNVKTAFQRLPQARLSLPKHLVAAEEVSLEAHPTNRCCIGGTFLCVPALSVVH